MRNLSPEIQYTLLIFGLFIVPKALERLRIPSAISCLVLGTGLGVGLDLYQHDSTIKMLATLGIVSMFLFAGLEVDFEEMRRGRRVLLQHVGIHLAVVLLGALVVHSTFGLESRAAVLCALALLTPSTGFILDSLSSFGLPNQERFWVKSKAIASELVALGALFVTVRSETVQQLAFSALALVALVAILPPLFRTFARRIAPFAPNTEFTFLLMVALLCAFVTRELGVYYLVGAFVVGLTAVRLRKDLPALSSHKLLDGVELFASFFIPFYFFNAGLHLNAEELSKASIELALVLLLLLIPLQIARVALHRRLALGDSWRSSARVGVAVLPTLVFTIVIADILKESFGLSPLLYGALIVYALVNTLIPGLLLRVPAPEFDTPEAPQSRPSTRS